MKRYESDAYDDEDVPPHEMEFIRANGRALRKLAFGIFVLLALELGAIWYFAPHAEEWTKPDQPCIPTVSDFDHAYRIDGASFAIAWWCDLPDGLYTRWFTGATPASVSAKSPATALSLLSGATPEFLLQYSYTRESTADEMELVGRIEVERAPRCYVIGTSATAPVLTSSAQGNISAAKLDTAGVGIRVPVAAPVSCQDRLAKETLKRYCKATSLTDTKQRRVEGDAWVACKLERAPSEGWK